MCLAVPGKILKIEGNVAKIDFGGVRRDVRMDLVPGAREGEYVLVHAGFAIQVLDERAAEETIKAWEEVGGA
ncbi:MAG: HypC/HybG/HupF family hydrogenase formation chaperone [Candidatus Hadarchaeales archaeon]